MKKCYLFGAGMNCYAVIKFIGRENIIAVVDNGESKIGLFIEGVEIISFQHFLSVYCGETVIITAYYARKQIMNQLDENNIKNFVTAPYMQKGYFESFEEMISSLEIFNDISKKEIYIYGENYFSQEIARILRNKSGKKETVTFVRDKKFSERHFLGRRVVEWEEVPIGANVLVVAEEYNDVDKCFLENNKSNYNMASIYEGKKKKHHELLKFKNVHKGKRCFIIGNGPSLRIQDLEILRKNKEICFGSNWIIKTFEQTEWRPDYYVVMDYNFMRIMPKSIQTTRGEKKIIFRAESYMDKSDEKDDFTYTYQSHIYGDDLNFSEDITEGIYGARTVTYDMLQIAAFMGFKEIYLLGVDCTKGNSHFYKPDAIDKSKLESRTVLSAMEWEQQYTAWNKGYKKAEEYSKSHDFKIYNATRGGELEAFERVDFDSLFEE